MSDRMINFIPLRDIQNSYKGLYVRYVGATTNIRSISKDGKPFRLVNGAYGICYAINGSTMYFAFREQMLLLPLKLTEITRFDYHMTIVPIYDKRWEIETIKAI